MLFFAQGQKVTVAVYEKGPKIVVQGKGTEEFVQFILEPEILGEARLMFRYLPEQRGLRRIGIVHDENVYGQNFRRRRPRC